MGFAVARPFSCCLKQDLQDEQDEQDESRLGAAALDAAAGTSLGP